MYEVPPTQTPFPEVQIFDPFIKPEVPPTTSLPDVSNTPIPAPDVAVPIPNPPF